MNGWADEELTSSELLACAVGEHPAFRSGAELDRIEPAELSPGERIDLLVLLEQQRRWFEAAQLRLLAGMHVSNTTELGLGEQAVSLAIQLPVRTAQAKLAQADTLVRELPRTLAAVTAGSISAAHAAVLAEAVWRLPHDKPDLPRRTRTSGAAAGTRRLRHRAAAQAPGPPGRARPGPLHRRTAASAGGGAAAGGLPPPARTA